MMADLITHEDQVVVSFRRWRVIGSGLAMAAVVPGAIAFGLLVPGLTSKILMVVIVLDIGWILTIFIRRVAPALRAGPVGYTIDESGIHGPALEVPSVAWKDVVSAKLADKRASGIVELTLINFERYVPANLLTTRHRLYKKLAPVAIEVLDLSTGSSADPFATAGTSLAARGDAKDVAAAAKDISDGLLRVPTLGFDRNANDVLDAIHARLAHRPTTP